MTDGAMSHAMGSAIKTDDQGRFVWDSISYTTEAGLAISVSGNIFWEFLTFFLLSQVKPRAAAAGGLRRRRNFWGMLLSSDHFY